MEALSTLPNIGKTLEIKLKAAGIETPLQLRETGSENALLEIRKQDPTACFSMLCALEGAILGIRWHHLPPQRKSELKAFLIENNIPLNPVMPIK